MKVINFYKVGEDFGYFSNFAAYPIFLKNTIWPTSEHYFQAQKFSGKADEEEIRLATSPGKAAKMGREIGRPLRKDWENVKESVMWEALYAKFTQHDELRRNLLATEGTVIVEHTKNDCYWADGGDGSGKNKLGILLMKLREVLKSENESRTAEGGDDGRPDGTGYS